MSVVDRSIAETPVAVLDFETTGLSPKTGARVIEIGVVRVEPGRDPAIALDTLVDPDGPVYATRIHGITDEDVLGAPLFGDLAGALGGALKDAVVAAFNASFDIRFLDSEFQRFPRGRSAWVPPHVCLMYLRPLLGAGHRCSLAEACAASGLPTPAHRAADDALAAAYLWLAYRDMAAARGIRTFGDLRAGGYKFADSLSSPMYGAELVARLGSRTPTTALKARFERTAYARPTLDQPASPPVALSPAAKRRRYWHSLVDALADGVITQPEIESLHQEQRRLALPPDDLRALHGKLAAEVVGALSEDEVITAAEAGAISKLFDALHDLGWAPGDNA